MAGNGRKTELVDVSKAAEAFGISGRQVQRLCIYEHMPRVSRGEYATAIPGITGQTASRW
jgi:hypothetical protein